MRHCIGLVAGCWLAAVIPLAAQEAPPRAVSDAGAGLYFGKRPSLNGPVFYARRWLPLPRSGGHMFAGGRFEYRDDDDSRGRAVSAGLGLEAAPTASFGPVRLQFPVHFGLEYVHVTPQPLTAAFPPDAKTGVHPRLAFGAALAFRTGTSEILFDLRRSFGTAGTFTAGTFGIRGTPGGKGGGVRLIANGLTPFSTGYEREADFLGYTLVYQRPLRSRVFDELRGSLGIDFIQFPGWSTGVVSLLFGGAIDVVSAPRSVSLQVVPQVGALKFVEPQDRRQFEPAAALGLEARLGPPAISGIVGASLIAASGPAGFLAGLQYRVGFGIGL